MAVQKEEAQSEAVDNVEQEDLISKYFKGSITQIITIHEVDGTEKVKQQVVDSFAAILVRVIGFKEIYEAWENQYQSAIDEFRQGDNQQSTKAH